MKKIQHKDATVRIYGEVDVVCVEKATIVFCKKIYKQRRRSVIKNGNDDSRGTVGEE